MTNSPTSSSSGSKPSSAFELLAEPIRRWVYQAGWPALRPIQEQAIAPILTGELDVILSAATASGKTEAAFLPALSRVHAEPAAGLRILYVAPLKALINDQFGRAEALCEALEIPVHRWHGDVAATRKRRVLDAPSGVLMITPESLEAIFVNHGPRVGRLMSGLAFVVVDELHAFIGNERGRQLQSLLHRIELATTRRIPRLALSATIGDISIAKQFLRPEEPERVQSIEDTSNAAGVKLIVKGFRTGQPDPLHANDDADDNLPRPEDDRVVAAHLFKVLRGTKNLVFANAKSEVEKFADLLRRASDQARVPNEFLAHHGSLAKAFREDAEELLKDDARPCSVVCTSTLEMGIDIGSVTSVAQIGAPFSVSSTRQRLGRSGRRDEPAILRFYIRDDELTPQTTLADTLRPAIVQVIAIVRLMQQRWCEPPTTGALHLSTLIQQLLSILAERGGASARQLHDVLCAGGPFREVSKGSFVALLRHLAEEEVISQMHEGTIVLAQIGERIVNHYTFYAAFQSPEEFRLVAEGKVIGSMPISTAVLPGTFLVFAGRRWKVVDVDAGSKTIELVAARGGRLPKFTSGGGFVHDKVRQEMKQVYESFEVPPFLDARAVDLLKEGRDSFVRLGLADQAFVSDGKSTLILPWSGDRVTNTLLVALNREGLETSPVPHGHALQTERPLADVLQAARRLAAEPPPSAVELAASVPFKAREKYDELLPEGLLNEEYASRDLDPESAWTVLRAITA